jgi:hypothetical protein
MSVLGVYDGVGQPSIGWPERPEKEAVVTGGLKVAVAVALGYFLGRHRRFKLAIALAVAGATGRLGGARGNLLEQGMKLVSSSPELEKIVNSVRGELFEAGKAAAKAAASRQVGSLSTKLQDRAEALQHAANVAAGLEETAAGAAEGVAEGVTEGVTKTARGGVRGLRDRATGGVRAARSRVRPPVKEEEEEPYEDEYDEYEEVDEEYEEEPRPRRGPSESRGRPSGRGAREPLDDGEEEPEDEEPAPRGRVVRDQPPAGSRPIRRTRE